MNIKTKDLNLLLIFDALWTEKNVSRAAERLSLTQPAVSNALARLRLDFNDPLFVRVAKGMSATPLAEKIHVEVEKILKDLSNLYQVEEKFDPNKSNRVITVMSTDYFEQLLLPKLLIVLEKEAPGMKLISRSVGGKLPRKEMEEGTCDLAIAGYFKNLPQGFFQQEVLQDKFKCVVRKKHPLVGQKLSLKKYLDYRHFLISPGGDLEGIVDRLLLEKGEKRNVVACSSSFMAPGHVIQKTDLILTAPSKLCEHFKELYSLEILDPPIAIPSIKMIQVWHEKVHNDPAIKWIRGKISDLLKM